MWMVFNREDNWDCGYSVANESEAREICEHDEKMTYMYVAVTSLALSY